MDVDAGTPVDPRAALWLRAEALAVQAQAGEKRAMDDLLTLIQPEVLRHCSRLLHNRLDAEEACQDAQLAVARNLVNFAGRSSFRTWLWTVTANASRGTYRRLKRQSLDVSADFDFPTDRRTSVIAGTRIDLLDGLEAIGELYATAVVLRDIADLSYTDIAIELGIPEGTVRSRIAKGRELLRSRMHG